MSIQHGDIVRVKRSFMGNPANIAGYVYDTYADYDDKSKRGVSIILANGADLGGFSHEEQQQYLDKIKPSGFQYEFKNVIKLGNDYTDGVFSKVFNSVSI